MAERSPPVAQLIEAIRGTPPPPDCDWTTIIAEANRTLTIGTMAERMLEGGHVLPEDVRSFLTLVRDRSAERNRRLLDQLEEALTCLNRHGIRPIPIKGMAGLMTQGQEGSRGRILSDLDLIVADDELAAAAECLEAIGYARDPESGDGTTSVVLFRTCDVGMIDLHSRLKGPGTPIDHALLAPLCVDAAIGAGHALLPSPTAQLLILIHHDQLQDRDYWRGLIDLRHMIDMEMLAAIPPGIDWDWIASHFPGGFLRRALTTQLFAGHRLLGLPVPPTLRAGWWPRLQHRRRLAQARWPALMAPLTALTLLCDPPDRAPTALPSPPRDADRRHGARALLAAGLRRFWRPKAAGKV